MQRRSRKSRMRPPEDMGEALRAAFNALGLTDQARRLEITRAWRAAVGPQIAARSEPEAFRRGVLLVKASSAAWQNELVFLRAEIVRKLNEALGVDMVRELKIVTGRVHESRREEPPPWTRLAPDAADVSYARATAASISDPEVRSHVERTIELALRHERYAKGPRGKLTP